MGCSSSKVEDLPLVTLCRERTDYLKAASDNRYALALAHESYFKSLRDVGNSLNRFVNEEILVEDSSPDLPPQMDSHQKRNFSSPSSSLHSVHSQREKLDECAECAACSHIPSSSQEEHGDPSHLHLSSGSEFEGNSCSCDEHDAKAGPSSYYKVRRKTKAYYMRRSSTSIPSMIYQEPDHSSVTWGDSSNFFSSNSTFPHQEAPTDSTNEEQPQPVEPPDPPSPNLSPWDFMNPFISDDNGYTSYQKFRHGYELLTSTPDLNEIREREGIPELEEDTDHEILKEVDNENKSSEQERQRGGLESLNNQDVASSSTIEEEISSHRRFEKRQVKLRDKHTKIPRRSSKKVKQHTQSFLREQIMRSPDSFTGKVIPDTHSTAEDVHYGMHKPFHGHDASSEVVNSNFKAKDVHYRTYMPPHIDDSSSESRTSPKHVTRDLIEIMKNIKEEFHVASNLGKDVASILEVEKQPYQSRATVSKVMSSMVPCLPSSQSAVDPIPLALSTTKAYRKYSLDPSVNTGSSKLSSTLEKLYMWEKKLYKEVKDEERLRVMYEKEFKKLKILDDRGEECSKIDAAEVSVRKLLTRIDVSFRRVQSISIKIHKVRDEELQPQLIELVNGFYKMWARMLKSHRKQFHVISNDVQKLSVRRGSKLQEVTHLEMEILKWSENFNNWIRAQRSYVQSLNEWLTRLLLHEPEETSDGVAPFSPNLAIVPPIFSICNDWCLAVERITENAITDAAIGDAMRDFARSLRRLREMQEEEERHRLNEESLAKDVVRITEMPFEEVAEMKRKLQEERARLLQSAASNSLPGGLVPIFESLVNFSSEALKAYGQVGIRRSDTVL